jgi:hypothetical protein
MSSSKKITCKGTLRQVLIRVYRLEIQSVMLVFSTYTTFVNYCPSNLFYGSPPPSPLPYVKVQYIQTVCRWEEVGRGCWVVLETILCMWPDSEPAKLLDPLISRSDIRYSRSLDVSALAQHKGEFLSALTLPTRNFTSHAHYKRHRESFCRNGALSKGLTLWTISSNGYSEHKNTEPRSPFEEVYPPTYWITLRKYEELWKLFLGMSLDLFISIVKD